MTLLLLLTALSAEPDVVRGSITDANGAALAASLDSSGEMTYGATLSGCPGAESALNLDGSFVLQVPAGGCTLVASSRALGSTSLSVRPGQRAPVRLALPRAPMAASGPVILLGHGFEPAAQGSTAPVGTPAVPAGLPSMTSLPGLGDLDPAMMQQLLADPQIQQLVGNLLGGGGEVSPEAPELQQIQVALQQLQDAL